MPKRTKGTIPKKHVVLIRIAYIMLLAVLVVLSSGAVLILKTKEFAFLSAQTETSKDGALTETKIESFPIGVDSFKETITENPKVDVYFDTHISKSAANSRHVSWLSRAIGKFAQHEWYQNLASPVSRILVIEPGERKEQVADNFGDILKWSIADRDAFITKIASSSPELTEGKFFPGHYVADKNATPDDVANMLIEHFDTNVASHYSSDISKLVPFKDAMTIASLLEREAYDFEDMRYISGVIWNRLFTGMNLQIDASLQYAKVTNTNDTWWLPVYPKDKYINSPFNTYKNAGLPPAPIASPSVEAILAALNPKSTNCMFYFHDSDGGFHCTETYEEHVALLKEYYGRGK